MNNVFRVVFAIFLAMLDILLLVYDIDVLPS